MSFIKKLSLHRPIWDYSRVQVIYGNIIRGKRFQLRKQSVKSKFYLNVGCGKILYDNFINLDYLWIPKLDLCWDITKGIPLEDNSLQGIFTEHCLEHLCYEDVHKVLLEFRRILRPGGILRIIVPDVELYMDIYQKGKGGEKIAFPFNFPAYKTTPKGETPIMQVRWIMNADGEHRSAYDYMTLEKMLKDAGFVDIRREKFKQGRDKVLLIDTEEKSQISLYVEASAP